MWSLKVERWPKTLTGESSGLSRARAPPFHHSGSNKTLLLQTFIALCWERALIAFIMLLLEIKGKRNRSLDKCRQTKEEREEPAKPDQIFIAQMLPALNLQEKRNISLCLSLTLSLSQVTLMSSSRCFPKPFTSQSQNYNCPPFPKSFSPLDK